MIVKEFRFNFFGNFPEMMRTLLLLVPLLVVVQSEGECNGVEEDFNQCAQQ